MSSFVKNREWDRFKMRAYVTQNKLFEVTKTMSTLKIYTNRQIYRVCVYFCTVPMKIMWRDERAGGRLMKNVTMSKTWFRGYFWVLDSNSRHDFKQKKPEHDKYLREKAHKHMSVIKMSRPFTSNDKICVFCVAYMFVSCGLYSWYG